MAPCVARREEAGDALSAAARISASEWNSIGASGIADRATGRQPACVPAGVTFAER
jgi:hypothetical protein